MDNELAGTVEGDLSNTDKEQINRATVIGREDGDAENIEITDEEAQAAHRGG